MVIYWRATAHAADPVSMWVADTSKGGFFCSWKLAWRHVPKRPNSSRNRAQHAFPAQRRESLTAAYWRPNKKQSLCHTYLLQKPTLRVHWLVPKQPNSSRNRAQHAFPAQRPESLTAAYWRPNKKQSLCHTYSLPLAETSFKSPLAGSETAEQQQESCPTCLPSTAPRISNVAYWRPKKTKLLPHLPTTHCRSQLWESIGWFRNGQTAAGIVPNMPSQHSAPNL